MVTVERVTNWRKKYVLLEDVITAANLRDFNYVAILQFWKPSIM